jgi:hypothetical protein
MSLFGYDRASEINNIQQGVIDYETDQSTRITKAKGMFQVVFFATILILLSACNTLDDYIPASASSVKDTRRTIAELANYTAPNTAIAQKANTQALQEVGITPPIGLMAQAGGMVGSGGLLTAFSAIAYAAYRTRFVKKLLYEVAEKEPAEAHKHLNKKLA